MEKIKLPDVTLCCISSINLDQAAYALAKSCEGIEFAEAKLIGHQRPDSLPDYIGFEESLSRYGGDQQVESLRTISMCQNT